MNLEIIRQYTDIIIIVISSITVISFLMNIIALTSLSKLKKRYKKMMRGNNNKNIEDVINKYMDDIEKVEENSNNFMNQYDILNAKINKSIQKTSVIRYKAFEDVGSDLSFSIALLDGDNNGLILTSIFGRNESTVYAKPIDNGISRYEMSEEEEEALKSALVK